ncbi:probable tubulin polyglutamylase TTLL9 isoform X2 [Lineus longissimus]|uniref:probable tubulin polyglutamylase TTLL9 isoform X2 n=1 Tax=Lineus longissimus TaxID=88925 RepID=UPI002B4D73F9
MAKNTKVPGYMLRTTQRQKGIGDRAIWFKCSLQNTILDVLRHRGWQEVSGDADYDLNWCDVGAIKDIFDNAHLHEHMRISHFRNHYELTRKNLMVKNLKRTKRATEKEQGKLEAQKYDFFPTTFELPSEYHIFVEEFKKNPGTVWIMKPVAKSQGKGIFLFKKLKDITDWKKGEYQIPSDPNRDAPETYVVQRYIMNPYLIGGRKFDMRIYLLVTSYIPLKAWLYRGGFARFSNTRYSLESIDDNYVHLTNVAIQKTAPDYDPEKGCKWSLPQLRQYLIAKHGLESVERSFRDIDNILIKSLQSVQKVMINDKHCFEMYGYDILFDSDLKPWLVEINASPSLTASNKDDYDLKFGLMEDVLNIIDMEGRLSGKEKRVGGFDLIWEDGPIMATDLTSECLGPQPYPTNSYLGCQNDRRSQTRALFRSISASKKR